MPSEIAIRGLTQDELQQLLNFMDKKTDPGGDVCQPDIIELLLSFGAITINEPNKGK